MQTYLVGGAVRDRLLGKPVAERDWVVVGATPAELEQRGYVRVGRSFPVFLHPESHEEYALARTERKTSPGYRGFEVFADPGVTLEQDLLRRDLTINAMAEDENGRIIDPYGGRDDLTNRLLRHVSDAFREDPVRILRVARFAARFGNDGFRVAAETTALMRDMVGSGEASALIADRVWQETERALAEPRPDLFVSVLRDCGALAALYPEVDRLFGVPQPPRWHPEIDTGVHILMALREAARRGAKPEVCFAVMVHDLGKGTTPAEILPKHPGHETRSVALIEALCGRLPVPNRFRDLALVVARFHGLFHRAPELRASTMLDVLERIGAFQHRERVGDFLAACEADARGRTGLENSACPQRAWFEAAFRAAQSVEAAPLAASGLTGEAIGAALRRARIAAIEANRPPD